MGYIYFLFASELQVRRGLLQPFPCLIPDWRRRSFQIIIIIIIYGKKLLSFNCPVWGSGSSANPRPLKNNIISLNIVCRYYNLYSNSQRFYPESLDECTKCRLILGSPRLKNECTKCRLIFGSPRLVNKSSALCAGWSSDPLDYRAWLTICPLGEKNTVLGWLFVPSVKNKLRSLSW